MSPEEEHRVELAGDLLDQFKELARSVKHELRVYKVKQNILYGLMFGALIAGAYIEQRRDDRSIASQREGCERVNAVREYIADKEEQEIASTERSLKKRFRPDLEQLRADAVKDLRRDKRALANLRRSVEHPLPGHPYILDCTKAYP